MASVTTRAHFVAPFLGSPRRHRRHGNHFVPQSLGDRPHVILENKVWTQKNSVWTSSEDFAIDGESAV